MKMAFISDNLVKYFNHKIVSTYSAVAGRTERLLHSLFSSGQNITTSSHRSSNQNRLTSQLKNKQFILNASIIEDI